MILDWTIKVGDILTSFTIIVSVSALIISWSKDRTARKSEQAIRVRTAAAKTLTKLDRWQILHLSLYNILQPTFVETSELFQKEFNVVETRDHLWKVINTQRTHISAKVLEEEIETAYVDLLSHFPTARNLFIDAIEQLNNLEDNVTGHFLEKSQEDVISFKDKIELYTTAMLGNALRYTARQSSEELQKGSNKIIQPIREFLFNIIGKSDKEILRVSREILTG
jgi:hypothetical protein